MVLSDLFATAIWEEEMLEPEQYGCPHALFNILFQDGTQFCTCANTFATARKYWFLLH